MAADTLSQPILDYVSHGAYPESESVASATLSSSDLATVLQSLNKAQDEAKNEIRTLSASTAGDIDSWITNAKALQADILRSREVARQIVHDAEEAEKSKSDAKDKGNKILLLEREVDFNESLAGTLEHVRYANGLLQKAQDEAVKANVGKALERLEDAEASIAGLERVQASRACEVLNGRADEMRRGLRETVAECWNALVAVNYEQKAIRVEKDGLKTAVPEAAVPVISLEQVVQAAKGLETFDSLLLKLGKDMERTIFRPRLMRDENNLLAKVKISGSELNCFTKDHDVSSATLFHDLHTIFDFLARQLPPSIAIPLSTTLMPALSSRLEDRWLDPALPLTLEEVRSFSPVLDNVNKLADQIDKLGWHGSKDLREWVSNAPRAWLTKRREAVLGDVRALVFRGLKETKTVERVETRVVSQDDGMLGGGQQDQQGGDDDWDTAWDDPDDASLKDSEKRSTKADDDDDDASAWDLADEDEDKKDTVAEDGGVEDDAWGWGDGEDDTAAKLPHSPASRKDHTAAKPNGSAAAAPQIQPKEQALTLRETFTVTLIPDTLLATLQTLISDASTLATDPTLSTSSIAPASSALYTLPTLALAIYRATAPTAYASLPVGNMLVYNDASHLASQLRAWQASQPPASRLRLDKDVEALEAFAKRAYGSEMESQRTILRDLLDGAQGFANCTSPPFKGECEGAVEATLDRLQEVHKQWKPILSSSALLQSLGSLLSTTTTKIVSEIQDLPDISEPESQQLKALFSRLSTITSIFTQEKDGHEQDLTFVYSPTWLKFQYLVEILESSLADIKWMWMEGELALEFEAEEVVELVKALFAESELRRRAVGEIRSGARR